MAYRFLLCVYGPGYWFWKRGQWAERQHTEKYGIWIDEMTGQEQIYSGSGAGLYPGAGVSVFAVGTNKIRDYASMGSDGHFV